MQVLERVDEGARDDGDRNCYEEASLRKLLYVYTNDGNVKWHSCHDRTSEGLLSMRLLVGAWSLSWKQEPRGAPISHAIRRCRWAIRTIDKAPKTVGGSSLGGDADDCSRTVRGDSGRNRGPAGRPDSLRCPRELRKRSKPTD